MNTQYQQFDVKTIPSLVSSVDCYSSFFNFTPAIACDIIENFMYEKQRSLSIYRINEFSAYMESGDFETVSTIIFAVTKDGPRCIDGQHTLRALMKSEIELALPVLVIKGDENRLYSKIDRGKSRTLKDSLQANDIPDKIGLPATSTLKAATAMKVILDDYSFRGPYKMIVKDEDIFALLDTYTSEIQHCFSILQGLELHRKLQSRVPLTIFLTLYKHLELKEWEKVDNFIYGCATDDKLAADDPRKLVYKMYLSTVSHGGGGKKPQLSKNDEMSIILLCWSKFYKGLPALKSFSHSQRLAIREKKNNLEGTKVTISI